MEALQAPPYLPAGPDSDRPAARRKQNAPEGEQRGVPQAGHQAADQAADRRADNGASPDERLRAHGLWREGAGIATAALDQRIGPGARGQRASVAGQRSSSGSVTKR